VGRLAKIVTALTTVAYDGVRMTFHAVADGRRAVHARTVGRAAVDAIAGAVVALLTPATPELEFRRRRVALNAGARCRVAKDAFAVLPVALPSTHALPDVQLKTLVSGLMPSRSARTMPRLEIATAMQ